MDRSPEEFSVKLQRLRAFMSERSITNLLITEAHHFSWLTGGGENFVFLAKSGGAAPLLVTQERVCLVSDTIEAARMFPEELAGLPIEDKRHEWYLTPDAILDHYTSVCAEPMVRDTEIESDLHQLHVPLLDEEIERYRWLGARAEEAIRMACMQVQPGMTEYQVAGLLSNEAYQRNIWPVLTLVASDERLMNYRHPLPTNKPVQRNVMLVLCARRHGLIANATRIVSFGSPSEELVTKHKAVCDIDTTLILSSKPGTRYGEILSHGIERYKETGFSDEWTLHHQGGPSGYLGRYFKTIPETEACVQENQAIAWNPSISGTKSEDTVLVTPGGVEILTQAKDWPMLDCHTSEGNLMRCDILTK